jgi:phosphoadenosine phosphosulfate reductase
MLIKCDRHTKKDLILYKELNEMDKINYKLNNIKRKEDKSLQNIKDFINEHKNKYYCSVSWGKDSIVVTDLCLKVDKNIPVIWIKVIPIYNIYCDNVRDIFIKKYPYIRYFEYIIYCKKDENGIIHAKGTLEKGFKKAVKRFGENYITGIRQEESGIRKLRSKLFGVSSNKTCAPLNYWKNNDVFAYLAYYDLPIHSNYGMLGGGRYKRENIRVASLGGKRGREMGRYQWEEEYYNDYLRKYRL